MNLEQLEKEWSTDAHIDKTRLDDESLNIPKLHGKYYGEYIRARAKLVDMRSQHEKLEFILTDYYKKNLSASEIEDYGLGALPERRIMKDDVPKFVATHVDNVLLKKQIGMQNEKVDFLKSILAQIGQRSFLINNAIKFAQFQAGVDG